MTASLYQHPHFENEVEVRFFYLVVEKAMAPGLELMDVDWVMVGDTLAVTSAMSGADLDPIIDKLLEQGVTWQSFFVGVKDWFVPPGRRSFMPRPWLRMAHVDGRLMVQTTDQMSP
jgi:hypothetical protein